MMPRTGGIIVYLRESYPPYVSFLYGWTETAVICPGALAAVAMICTSYLGYFVPDISLEHVLMQAGPVMVSTQHLAIFAVLALLGAVNYAGVRFGGIISNVSTFAKVAALLGLVFLALIVGGSAEHFSTPSATGREMSLFGALGTAMVGILFSYNGWYNTNNVAGEVKDPRRVLPLAIIIGLSLCMLVYLAVNWAYLLRYEHRRNRRVESDRRRGSGKADRSDRRITHLPGGGRRHLRDFKRQHHVHAAHRLRHGPRAPLLRLVHPGPSQVPDPVANDHHPDDPWAWRGASSATSWRSSWP